MTTPGELVITITVRWDDGATTSSEITLECEPTSDLPLTLTCEVSVPGTRMDDGAIAAARRVITNALDDLLRPVHVLSDLDHALGEAARRLVVGERPVTDVQSRKFAAFVAHPMSEEATAALRGYVSTISDVVTRDELGVSWGVTVLVDPKAGDASSFCNSVH